MWLPVMMGGRLLLRPARRMKPLPILSMVTVMPASLAQPVTRSRPCLSRSVSVRRQTPPLGVAPIWASSISEAHRRSPLMRRLSMPVGVAVSMGFSGRLGAQRARRGWVPAFQRALGRREVCAKRRPLDVAALALHGAQVALHEHQLALAQRVGGDAAHGAAFEDVEVALAVLGLGRQGLRALAGPRPPGRRRRRPTRCLFAGRG